MSLSVFNAYSHYYDLLYRDKDYNSEVNYLKKLLTFYGVESGSLLEFGSGTGKHGAKLSESGYKVHGIEFSKQMLNRAKTSRDFTCQQGDITNISMGYQYDAVFSLFHVISYQTTNQQIQAVFANAARHIKSSGFFIFDFWYSPAVNTQKPQVRIKKIVDDYIEVTRIAEPISRINENCVDVNYTIYVKDIYTNIVQTILENHSMRHFSLPEIDLLSSINGFERVGAEEFLTGNSPDENTWGVCVILKKI